MIPFDAINGAALAALPSLLAEWFPHGVRRGHEYVIGDLYGNAGESLSINLNSCKWADFASGVKGGDPISLCAAKFHGGERVPAARDLGRKLGVYHNGDATPHVAPVASAPSILPAENWQSCDPPEGAQLPALTGFDVLHTYRNAAGEPVRYVGRKNATGDKRKTFVPITYGILNGAIGWHRKQASRPRCLYGLDRLASMPDRTVVICEGEKSADAAQQMLPDWPCITWSAGTENAASNDWSPLAGRRILIWPDNDTPGHKCAAALRDILAPIAAHIETLSVDDLAEGADAADINPSDPLGWISARVGHAEPEQGGDYNHADYPDDEPERDDAEDGPDSQQEGIVPLGHDRGTYYYLSRATGQVEAIQAAQHTRAMLTHLASESYYWQRTRFAGKKGVDWNAAADDLRVKCRAVGIFDPDRLRGLGAWFDDGKSILHIGDKLVVDGNASPLLLPGSTYVYEQSARLKIDIGEPLTSAEAKRLMDLCMAAPWESPEHMGRLLAGWCVIAPVCGAMPWRPHLWITSEAGAGKSWLLDNIVKPTVGPLALEVQSKSTEAGIRQTLGCDARPVIFDEAETQNDSDRARVQLVLDLARQASNEGGAPILKGAQNGKAMRFHIRSCFAFSSINVGMSQAADESRTVVLNLAPSRDEAARQENFANLKKLHAEVMTHGFAGRLLARTLSLLPTIRANAAIFADAIARMGQSRRAGDTYGVLLAGAWSLRSRSMATPAEADEFIAKTVWVREAVKKGDVESEWQRALTTLLQHRLRVMGGNGRGDDIPIGELIDVCRGNVGEGSVRPHDAETALNRTGIKVGWLDGMGDVLFVGNHSTACADAFGRTPWAVSWLPTLCRAPGARRNATNMRLAGNQTKVLAIPLGRVTGEVA